MAAPASVEAAPEEAPSGDGQPPREGRSEQEGRREHGRRGRRGRRRGGRGNGGIPESKYFTPGAERQSGPAEARTEQAEEEAEEPVTVVETRTESESQPYERLVLPGESLAKYSAAGASQPDTDEPEEAEPENVEPAIPMDHHLAGFTWVSPSPIIGAPPEDGPVVEAIAEAEPVRPDLIPTPDAPAEILSPEDEEEILAAAEAVEAIQEAADEIAIGVPAFGIDEEVEEVECEEEAAGTGAENEAEPESAIAERGEELPEPARTPVSLTATLREQGHRYPHRVSRRSRRRGGRNRGGEDRGPRPDGAHQTGGAPAASESVADADEAAIDAALAAPENGQAVVVEEKSPALREDRRDEKREERRGGRDRGGRARGRGREGKREGKEREADRERPELPSISDLLKEGQEIIVQISKEPLGQKGARITSHIALPGRFVVYMPTVDHAGVSRKIPSEEERHRLKKVLQTHRQGVPGGYICRTEH